jgi:preprotein translocase subunit SecD
MIYYARWKAILTIILCAMSLVYCAPNLAGTEGRAWLSQNLPSWLPNKTVNLGLDLRGGSHLQLQVDVDSVIRTRSEDLVNAARPELRSEKVGYTKIASIPGGMRLTLKEGEDVNKVRQILRGIDNTLNILVSEDRKTVEATLSEQGLKEIRDQTIDQSIEIVRRRVDESGTKEPNISRQGDDRIIVQLPGVDDPQYIKTMLGKTAKLTFHLVDLGDGAAAGGVRELPMQDNPGQTIPIQRKPLLTGDMLVNAQPSFQDGMAVVSFRLNTVGAKKFCEVTRANTNKPFAIVLDNVVLSAPNINEPICGGSAIISGGFSVQETNDLSILLRAGALPAPLHVMEERTVGPSLGADSVEAGKTACLMAVLFVTIMMCVVYGLFGVFSSITLWINMAMILAIMSVLQATLTLPGIAGIVLTIGLAVDANVLIYERMKEELRSGRSIGSALDTAYKRALTTITDSNLTSLIAAIILFSFGTGPIKGFAVTMSIGVVTSFFCAMMLTRLMIVTWLHAVKPKAIPV